MRDDDLTLEQMRAGRARLREKFGPLHDSVAQILFSHDPMQLSMGFNQGEYLPEVDAILARLDGVRSALELRRVVWEVFKELFAPDEEMAERDAAEFEDDVGEEIRFDGIANDIWRAYVNRPENS